MLATNKTRLSLLIAFATGFSPLLDCVHKSAATYYRFVDVVGKEQKAAIVAELYFVELGYSSQMSLDLIRFQTLHTC